MLALAGCSTGSERPSPGMPGVEPGGPITYGTDGTNGITGDEPAGGTSTGQDGLDGTGGDDAPPAGGCDTPMDDATPLGGACTDDCSCASGHCFLLPLGGVCSECTDDAECTAEGGSEVCTVDPTIDPPFAHCAEATVGGAGLFTTTCEDLEGSTFDDEVKLAQGVEITAAEGSTNAQDRREQVRISQGLADELGIDQNAVSDSGPAWQVRVTLDDVEPDSTANFTVAEIDPEVSELRLEVSLPNGGSDKNSGFHKLFGSANVDDVLAAEPHATVHLAAPGTTVIVSDAGTTSHVHFPEPNSGQKLFRECVELHDDTLAVVVPHGGDIEQHISDELPGLLSTLADLGQTPSVWAAVGRWSGGGGYHRWHITATQISEESFPGYTLLDDAGPYKYTLSLHGFGSSKNGVVVGGRAGRQLKCFLVQRIEQERSVSTTVRYKIHAPDGGVVEVNGSLGVSGYTGQSQDNIVNRLSSTDEGAGGIQLELSTELRKDAELFADFMHALAIATDDLVDLQLVADPEIDYCSMLD